MEEYEVHGAHDQSLSSREKDRLFADEPRKPVEEMDDGERALAEHRAAVGQVDEVQTRDLSDSAARARAQGAEPAEGMLAQPVPDRHVSGGPYEEEAVDATVDDADFEAEETNRKGGSA